MENKVSYLGSGLDATDKLSNSDESLLTKIYYVY